jgi:hypothetical protein
VCRRSIYTARGGKKNEQHAAENVLLLFSAHHRSRRRLPWADVDADVRDATTISLISLYSPCLCAVHARIHRFLHYLERAWNFAARKILSTRRPHCKILPAARRERCFFCLLLLFVLALRSSAPAGVGVFVLRS